MFAIRKQATVSAERMPIGRHSESTEGQLKLSNSDLLDPATPFRRDGEVARA
ncbi:hypothetical protein RESH_05681 [Rhodopirellula europaea SH398]|uniref:Uncharacterized protein n=1 Tax=Rhodopirellula europaea SH398 TaxID=1263868 RepID=M5RX19_9BACT|nr:hypothetical protein RESH_05681 [Rhodopirellula europaea SH398]